MLGLKIVNKQQKQDCKFEGVCLSFCGHSSHGFSVKPSNFSSYFQQQIPPLLQALHSYKYIGKLIWKIFITTITTMGKYFHNMGEEN